MPSFDPLADLTYSSDLLNFFESLEPAVDPVAFTSNSDWMTDLPAMAGPSTLLEAQQILEEGVAIPSDAESGLAPEMSSSGTEMAQPGPKTEGERVEELFAAEDQAAAIPICELSLHFMVPVPPLTTVLCRRPRSQ